MQNLTHAPAPTALAAEDEPTPMPAWKAGLQLATTATWTAIGIPTAAAPYCVTQTDIGGGQHTGNVHYLLLAPLLEIARAYDVAVSELSSAAGTTYTAVVPVDGVNVTIWTTNPTDANSAVTG
ncbi:hypothetical protein [uncultured Streptomyces sp.]|uniref:hypothetical protein n=1 Tax=uncultured Streptomyces sp. TaxID=174707 RepID=UPI00262E3784|nr:hypothetical protein [uncultured Streptomyces sp.]